MKKLLFYSYIFTLFVITQTIIAEKTQTQEPKNLDDDFFADLFKPKNKKAKPAPPKKAKKTTKKKARKPQKQKDIKAPTIKEIQRLEKEIASIGKEITDMSKELTKFPTTEPMKKQIEDLKKEEEKKAQDAEKRRKDLLKSSGSSKYKPSRSDYSSGGHRSGRRYDDDSGSSWSPWGGSGSSDSGGRGRSSLGDSSSTPSSSFGKDEDKSSTSLTPLTSTTGTTPDKTSPGGVAGGQSDETTKAATKKYILAARLYVKALARIERYTKGGSEKEKENIDNLLSNPDDCAIIIKAINDAGDARKGAIPESVFNALDKQRNGEVTNLVKKVQGAVTAMFPIALKAATQIDDKELKPTNPTAQEKIKNDFLSKQIVKDIIPRDQYKPKINEQEKKLLEKFNAKYNSTELSRSVETIAKTEDKFITLEHTKGKKIDTNHFDKAKKDEYQITTPANTEKIKNDIDKRLKDLENLKALLPGECEEMNKKHEDITTLNKKIDVKKRLTTFNKDNQDAAKKSKTELKNAYEKLKLDFDDLKKDLMLITTKDKIDTREELFNIEYKEATK